MRGCKKSLRQIIVKDHGRNQPTFILINNKELTQQQVLEVYAKRWHIEKKLAEREKYYMSSTIIDDGFNPDIMMLARKIRKLTKS